MRLTHFSVPSCNSSGGATEGVVTYTTRVRKSASLLRGTKHAFVFNDMDVKRRWRFGLGPDFSPINHAFDVLGITPKGWDMSQSLILLTARALKIPLTLTPTTTNTTITTPPAAAGTQTQATGTP